jgi:hypothetical protein
MRLKPRSTSTGFGFQLILLLICSEEEIIDALETAKIKSGMSIKPIPLV